MAWMSDWLNSLTSDHKPSTTDIAKGHTPIMSISYTVDHEYRFIVRLKEYD